MRVVRDNIVGLFRFVGLLSSVIMFPLRKRGAQRSRGLEATRIHIGEVTDNKQCPHCNQMHTCDYCDDWHYCDCGYWWKTRENEIVKDFYEDPKQDKYKSIIGSPSEPLIPTETKFCPKCHVPVAQVRHTKRGTEIIQHGKVLVTVGSNVIIQNGKRIKGFPFECPNGHTVRIE